MVVTTGLFEILDSVSIFTSKKQNSRCKTHNEVGDGRKVKKKGVEKVRLLGVISRGGVLTIVNVMKEQRTMMILTVEVPSKIQ